MGGGTVTVPLCERQNGTGTNQPIEGGGGPPQPPDGGVEELGHCPQKGVEECLSNQQVEEEVCHLVVMEVVMEMVMIMEEVVGHLPQGEMEEMVVMMEMVVEEMIHHHCQTKDSHDTIEIEEIDGCVWYKDCPDPQVNWDKMEGMVGMDQIPQMPRGIINVPGVAPAPLDTTGLENSFEI